MFKVLAIAILLSSLACTNKAKKREQQELAVLHLKIGTGYLTQANYPLAIKELRHANKLYPKNPAILNNLGLAYYLRKEYDLARVTYEEALRARPGYTEVRNNLARLYIDIKEYDMAIAELKEAVKDLVYPKPEKSWTNLGFAYLKVKKYSDARKALNKAIELRRNYCPAYTLYGRTLYEEKQFDKAADSFDQAIQQCKTSRFDEPVYYSALSHLKMGHLETARAKLNEIITKYPDGPFTQKARSILKMIH